MKFESKYNNFHTKDGFGNVVFEIATISVHTSVYYLYGSIDRVKLSRLLGIYKAKQNKANLYIQQPYQLNLSVRTFTPLTRPDPSHKSHDAWDKYSTMHHFVIEMCTRVHISVTKCCTVGWGTGVSWDLCNRSIVRSSADHNPFKSHVLQTYIGHASYMHIHIFTTELNDEASTYIGPGLGHHCVWRYLDTLHWRHNGHDSVSNHQPYDCLLNCLFRRRSKIISKLRVTGLCAGNSPETGEFPAQMASNAENVSIWWRHHDLSALGDQQTQGWR